jgi:hypothetical protein
MSLTSLAAEDVLTERDAFPRFRVTVSPQHVTRMGLPRLGKSQNVVTWTPGEGS